MALPPVFIIPGRVASRVATGLGSFLLALGIAALLLLLIPGKPLPVPPVPAPPGKTVVVDPGHGGIDGGATYGNVLEKEINLDIGRRVAQLLAARGVPVILTRDADVELDQQSYRRDLQRRLDIAQQNDAWALIAIHANSTNNTWASGSLVLHQKDDENSRSLAKAIRDELEKMQPDKLNLVDAEYDHYYFDRSPVPTVAVEVGFLSNPGERLELMRPDFRAKVAKAIADGVEREWRRDPLRLSPAPARDDGAEIGHLLGNEHQGPRHGDP